ncbi:DUF4249 family protein [Ekhidna sp.]
MRFLTFLIGWLVFLLSCSEPFEFERGGSLMILDGKVSTEIGKSFIRIYQLNQDGTSTSYRDFDIKVIDTEGQEFSFTTIDTATNEYVSSNFGFTAKEGVGYKVIATQDNGITLESTFDVVKESIDFDFNIGDTTVVETTQSSEPVLRQATSAIASIPFDGNPVFSKMAFEYRYMDLFTLDTVTVKKEDDFVLFSCDDSNNCKDVEDVTAGFTTRFEWFFIKVNRFCDSLAATPLNFVENCDVRSVGCCEYREQWPTIFQLNVESLSPESFEFWEDLERLTKNNGLIFDTYPFPLKGNVTCDGCEGNFFGLLRASSETTKERIVIL